jgi:hypothetical protein
MHVTADVMQMDTDIAKDKHMDYDTIVNCDPDQTKRKRWSGPSKVWGQGRQRCRRLLRMMVQASDGFACTEAIVSVRERKGIMIEVTR